MNEAHEITRILFEGFSNWSIYLFYVIGYTAIGIFIYGVYVQIRKYRRGKPDASWGEFLHALKICARPWQRIAPLNGVISQLVVPMH